MWLSDRQERGWQATTTEAWLVGYLTGLAMAFEKDILKGTDNPSVFAWMDNRCKANPLSNLSTEGGALFFELVRQKKL